MEQVFIKTLENIQVETIPTDITIQQWKDKFRHWKESKSTSPSGIHLGHYKALTEIVYIPSDTELIEDLELKQEQTEMMTLQVDFINAVIKSGYSLKRWRKVHNMIIPKQSNNYDMLKQRSIHIYEADWNAILSIKWREAMIKAEEEGKLHASQYGSRQGKSAHDPIYWETMQHDISRMQRQAYGQINYDAKSCYDRILPNLAAIVSQAFGVPKEITSIHYHFLKNAEYSVKIEGAQKLGSYQNREESPVLGTGQGSGNSPFIWAFLSSVLLKMFNNIAIGARYQTTCSNKKISIKHRICR